MQAAKVSKNARKLLEVVKSCHRALAKLGNDKHDDGEMRKTMKKLAALVRSRLLWLHGSCSTHISYCHTACLSLVQIVKAGKLFSKYCQCVVLVADCLAIRHVGQRACPVLMHVQTEHAAVPHV
jgi:hypothetical protein